MHRDPLLRLLDVYDAVWPTESACVARVRTLVREHANCFERTCLPGHITASAWILSADGGSFLMTHHRKLDRWLQLGGHADGDADVLEVALREAREESGMERFEVLSCDASGRPMPFDVDVHDIPAHGGDPPHAHHDIRFLLRAGPDQPLRISDESNDLRWFESSGVADVADEESLLRMASKVPRFVGALR